MSPQLLETILKKAKSESPIDFVGLYNWTEPLLHPQIGELINIVNSFGLRCLISSNLNISKRLEDVIKAQPAFFRVSLSGFTNHIYQQQHRGGDVERVKENMRLLADLVRKYNSKTHIEIYYLRWLGNLDEEFFMQEFAENLGFTFKAEWAWMCPIEKQIAILSNDESGYSDEDILTVNSLARPFLETVNFLMTKYANSGCPYIHGVLTLDCTGRVSLCCGTFNQELYTIGNYLDYTLSELNSMKLKNDNCKAICNVCTGLGLPALGFVNDPELNNLPVLYVLERYAKKMGTSLASI